MEPPKEKTMAHVDKYKDDFILLCEAGFIAVNQMDDDAAKKLFAASLLLDPKNTLPKTGMGYLHLCKLELKEAAQAFEEVLKVEPDNEMTQAFLGVAMSLSPQEGAKGEKLLEESTKTAKDPSVKTLASSALEFVDKFIKKTPSPVEIQKPKK